MFLFSWWRCGEFIRGNGVLDITFGSSIRTGMRDKTQMDHADSAAAPLWMVATLVLTFSVQIKKKSQQKAKQEERMSKEFAKMEEAAMKAYQEDLKRMEREAAGRLFTFSTTCRLLVEPGLIL